MSPSKPPTDPFRSARLIYRAVDTPGDNALFSAINDDRAGYVNSNAKNITLPGTADAQRYQKYVVDDTLLGAVICLPSASTSNLTSDERKDVEDRDLENTARRVPEAGIPIGVVHLSALSLRMTHHRNTEIAIDVLPAYQGKGYGSEAITWALDYAFRRAGLHRVSVRAFEWNEGAVRLYERLGFKHEGRGRETLWHEGRWWDGIEMGMLDREWWAMRERKEEVIARIN
ncbi:acyl-CoA N-acyltransferase [Melanomma pulvis-pyrius CBS 109.77]|uniref:Acyl-CoA N-acyltransferase n=1 Tax=Melanomma pulvis-pyrius CBS 109.77 TaxID=1314802 RepID=A0A6A6XVM0_9PLEO|nr:acyl-CoA N-acyltransferase [Melanomma pulvis-pyrius CBS 109.77]